VIRLILGEVCERDDADKNRYRRAGDDFRRWQAEKMLVRDPAPAIYLYQQIFQAPDGRELTRRGLIVLVRLEEFGGRTVFPHERTMAAPKEDRLRLMQSCHANLSPIFGIYPGPFLEVDRLFMMEEKINPTIDLRDWDGIRHRIWTFKDRVQIEAVRDAFESTPIFIADGHHRYETALAFRDLMRAKDRGDPSAKNTRPYNYIMMTLVSADDPGWIILPTIGFSDNFQAAPEAYLPRCPTVRCRAHGFRPIQRPLPRPSCRLQATDWDTRSACMLAGRAYL
jgi:uncharacterized protein (DUF1015 family)